VTGARPCRGTTLDTATTGASSLRSWGCGAFGVADPKSVHPEASYHARLPTDDTNASTRHAPHPSSGLPQKVDSAVDLRILAKCISCRVLFHDVSPSAARQTSCSRSRRLPHDVGRRTGALPYPNRKGATLLDVETQACTALDVSVCSARSRRHKVAVSRGTGFGSAPRGGAAA
jgi:hypothetical protein